MPVEVAGSQALCRGARGCAREGTRGRLRRGRRAGAGRVGGGRKGGGGTGRRKEGKRGRKWNGVERAGGQGEARDGCGGYRRAAVSGRCRGTHAGSAKRSRRARSRLGRSPPGRRTRASFRQAPVCWPRLWPLLRQFPRLRQRRLLRSEQRRGRRRLQLQSPRPLRPQGRAGAALACLQAWGLPRCWPSRRHRCRRRHREGRPGPATGRRGLAGCRRPSTRS